MKCRTCKRDLPEDCFYVSHRHKSGRATECKECSKKRAFAWSTTHRERINTRSRQKTKDSNTLLPLLQGLKDKLTEYKKVRKRLLKNITYQTDNIFYLYKLDGKIEVLEEIVERYNGRTNH